MEKCESTIDESQKQLKMEILYSTLMFYMEQHALKKDLIDVFSPSLRRFHGIVMPLNLEL
jgi:hypothetical protein